MILVFGMGNPMRQDDGAGRVLAQRLGQALDARGCPNRVLTVHQLAPEQALEFLAPALAAVCFVDMAIDEAYSGESARLRLSRLNDDAAAATVGRFTHEVGPLVLLAYGTVLGARVPPAWLLTVDGFATDHGEGFSPQVQAALADDGALDAIAQTLCTAG